MKKKKIPFTIGTKRQKYPGINLAEKKVPTWRRLQSFSAEHKITCSQTREPIITKVSILPNLIHKYSNILTVSVED